MQGITKGVGDMKVKKSNARRGSDVVAATVRKSRRRNSLMAGAAGEKSDFRLDGASSLSVPEEARRASLIPDVNSTCYQKYVKLSKVGFVPHNPYSASKKVNQDRPFTIPNFRGHSDQALFGVFDGHGSVGHKVSQFIIETLAGICEQNLEGQETEKEIVTALAKSFVDVNNALKEQGKASGKDMIDSRYSGTTAVMCYINGRTVYTANAGDSRATLGKLGEDEKWTAYDLSEDQKPELASEAARIVKHGGRVHACRDYDGQAVGPMRVWLGKQDVPGLAMTRSFGDTIAASVGVIPDPDVTVTQLDDEGQVIIIASDGVWEFITSQEAVDLVAGCKTPADAVKKLTDESTRRWQDEEEVIDDITAVLIYL